MKNIGVLGTGIVGRTLAKKLVDLGHQVMIGTRNVESTLAKSENDSMGNPPFKEWYGNNSNIKIGTFADSADFGDLILLATFGSVTINAIDLAGPEKFDGKVVVDTTNPLDFSEGIPPKFAAQLGNSLGEQIQKHIPNANVVKAFNSIGADIMVNPQREEGSPDFFIAGDNGEAKEEVVAIAKEFGWKSIFDAGDISQSYWLEAMTMLWLNHAFKNNVWSHAFKLLRK